MVSFLRKRRSRKEPSSANFSRSLVTMAEPDNFVSEDYRTLRTNLLYALVDHPPKVIVVTSPNPGEGKSTTCANLAVALAQAGKSTLAIDCDLRKPTMHRLFEVRNFAGVAHVLAGEHSLNEVWQEPLPGLKVVAAGSVPPNPAELLGSKRFAQIVGGEREEFDYILIDAPPVGLVSDATILATQGDGVLLVVDSQSTRKAALQEAVRSLETVGAKVLGTVMNNFKSSKKERYYYGYARD